MVLIVQLFMLGVYVLVLQSYLTNTTTDFMIISVHLAYFYTLTLYYITHQGAKASLRSRQI